MSIITDSLTEAYAEGKPLWSHALNTLFVLAEKPEVESRKAFCQVVNAATKCDSGVFKFKTSQAITAEKKISRIVTVMPPMPLPNLSL